MMFSQSFSPEVRETLNDLERLFHEQNQLDLKDKIAALYLFKLGRAKNSTDVARIIGQDTTTIEQWLEIYSRQGLKALLTI